MIGQLVEAGCRAIHPQAEWGLSFESIARLIREMKAMGVTILIIGDLHACGGGTFGVRVGSRHCLKRLWDGGGTA
ncbi:MAG: hypothetical protein M5R38_12360 [Candidatus Methylomirabilis sp.]|nr:hypothetical protein [Candidatus Methylomirabilis sp.]